MKKIVILFWLFLNVLLFAQESEGGHPFFFEYLDPQKNTTEILIDGINMNSIDLIPKIAIINKSLSNQEELIKLEELKKNIPNANFINFYGKKIDVKKDFKLEATKFKIEDKFICLLKIRSENAYSLQTFFSKFKIPNNSKFFLYNSKGMVLGSFSNKNVITSNESENVFVTQPIEGNEVYLELDLENESDLANVDIQINTIMHAFSNLYASDGPFSGTDASTFTSCNKNVSCVDGGLIEGQSYSNMINKGNIKSVGLIVNTNAIYGFTCSGTLINNTKQDGTPYFLTAEHCVKGTAQQPVFLNESVVIFNHETKNCNDSGSTVGGDLSSPSTNSVAGMQILTSAGVIQYSGPSFSTLSQDFALVKLNTTAETLKKYKICYSGWSTLQFPSNISYSFTAHHPAGTVKKISITNSSYITPTDYSAKYFGNGMNDPEMANVYFSKSFSTNLSSGYFLAAEFANGFPYHGSSGASLFTRDGFILGTLSTGPGKEVVDNSPTIPLFISNNDFKACGSDRTNKAKYNVLFSRFWRDYIFMQPWLNPDSQNIQSIGNYCPAGIGEWGSVTVSNNGTTTPQNCIQTEILNPDYFSDTYKDVNGYRVRPISTFGKKIYINKNYLSFPSNYNIKTSEKLISFGIGKCTNNSFLMGNVYKVTDDNKLMKFQSQEIIMKSAVYFNGNIPPYTGNIIGVTNDKVFVFFQQLFGDYGSSPVKYGKLELQTYKTVNNTLVEESNYDVFPDWQTLNSMYPNISDLRAIYVNENCIYILIERNQGGTKAFHRLKRSSLNSPWIQESFATSSFNLSDLEVKGNLLFSWNSGTLFIFNLDPNQTPTLVKSYSAPTYRGVNLLNANTFEFFTPNVSSGMPITSFKVTKANLSNIIDEYDLAQNFHESYLNKPKFSISNNDLVIGSGNAGEIVHYYRDQNTGKWVKSENGLLSNATFSMGTNSFSADYFATVYLDNNFFINDITWDIRFSGNPNYRNKLFTAFNIMSKADLKELTNNHDYQLAAAYTMVDNLERAEWLQNASGSQPVYNNKFSANNNWNWITMPGPAMYQTGQVHPLVESRPTYNSLSLILGDFTIPITSGNKSIKLQAPYSVVIKPGFGVSANTGVDFHVMATSNTIYPETLTYDDMLHPEISNYHDKASQKIASLNIKPLVDMPVIYGEIILLKDDILTEETKRIKIYPNPTDGILFIDSHNKKTIMFELFNISGQKLKEGEVQDNKIDVRFLNKGIYLLSLKIDNKIESFKFIKK